jgi:hypothetical protein
VDVNETPFSPNVLTWVGFVPVFLLPPLIIAAALIYGGVLPAGPGVHRADEPSGWRLLRSIGAGLALSVWTLFWAVVALELAVSSESLTSWDEPAYVREPFGLFFAVALIVWATPFVANAYRPGGLSRLLLAGIASLIAAWLIIDLFAHPLGCGCD